MWTLKWNTNWILIFVALIHVSIILFPQYAFWVGLSWSECLLYLHTFEFVGCALISSSSKDLQAQTFIFFVWLGTNILDNF